MKYKCDDCGAVFEEEDIAVWKESRGEFWGMPAYETMCGCPNCFSTSINELASDEEGEEDDNNNL